MVTKVLEWGKEWWIRVWFSLTANESELVKGMLLCLCRVSCHHHNKPSSPRLGSAYLPEANSRFVDWIGLIFCCCNLKVLFVSVFSLSIVTCLFACRSCHLFLDNTSFMTTHLSWQHIYCFVYRLVIFSKFMIFLAWIFF